MTDSPATALTVALAYHQAWTSGDLDRALGLVAAGVVCHSPAGLLTGSAALAGFMGPFAASLTSSTLLASFGDRERALLMYDTANPVVPSAPAAELYLVRDGLIDEIRIIFDRLPFALARGEVTRA